MNANKKYIFGIGTGRTGSNSLAKLLSLQEDTLVTHESVPLLSWNKNESLLRYKLKQLNAKDQNIVGDVSMTYLNYVEDILKICMHAKFVCFQRSVDEVVNSYLIKTVNRNHWIHHDGSKWQLDYKWDPCFPKYVIDDKKEALLKYVKDYKLEVEKLKNKYPSRIMIADMYSTLNDEEEQMQMFDFIGYWKNPKIVMDLRANSTEENRIQARNNRKNKYLNYMKIGVSKILRTP